jgi:hypothetical protein
MAGRVLLFDGQTGESQYSSIGIVTQRQQGLAIGKVRAADFRLVPRADTRQNCPISTPSQPGIPMRVVKIEMAMQTATRKGLLPR